MKSGRHARILQSSPANGLWGEGERDKSLSLGAQELHVQFNPCLLPLFPSLSAQIPYLGFCSCEELGDTGVWQLTDPPILPLTHGPTGGFNWRETLLQE